MCSTLDTTSGSPVNRRKASEWSESDDQSTDTDLPEIDFDFDSMSDSIEFDEEVVEEMGYPTINQVASPEQPKGAGDAFNLP